MAGRKTKLQQEEAKKSSKLMEAFLKKGGHAAGPSTAPKQMTSRDTEHETQEGITEEVEKLEEEKEE